MKTVILLISLTSMLLLFGCSNNGVEPSNKKLTNYPTSVGSVWRYAVYDSIAQKADTVKVTINSQISSSAISSKYLWLYNYSDYTDSVYVIISGDAIKYFSVSKSSQVPTKVFYYPLKEGAKYSDSYYSIDVTIESVSVPVGKFDGIYRIYEHPYIGNLYGGSTFWIAPDIGILKEQLKWHDTMSGELVNKTWELLSHTIVGS
jgi:hypothetical protein